MKNKLQWLILLAMSSWSIFSQSNGFDCEEDTKLATKYIVGSAYHLIDVSVGIEKLTAYADSGCLDAQLKLGEVYSKEYHGVFDGDKAFYYAKKAADAGNKKAIELVVKLCKRQIGCNLTEEEKAKFMTCEEKTKRAYLLLKGSPLVLAEEERALELLTKYANEGCKEAQFIVGRVYKRGFRDIAIDYDKAFVFLDKATKQDHPRAYAYLGQLYERGYGCQLDYTKAFELFERSYELGDDMGAYCMGYDYLRGMGNVEQSYDNALEWFQKSEYPMAIHWLAVMYYFGYGVPVDKDKAIELLVNNDTIYNSPILLEHLEANKDDEDTILGDFKAIDIEKETEQINEILTAESDSTVLQDDDATISVTRVAGEWQGKLVELDFAGEQIVRELPISITLTEDSDTGGVNYASIIVNNSNTGVGILLDDSVYFQDFEISIPKLYKHNEVDNLQLKILSADLELKKLNHIEYLTAYVDSKELNWNEKGAPMLLVLANTSVMTDNGVEITQEVISALLDAQGDNFIQLFPNPFQNDLLIQYELTEESNSTVEVYSLDGLFYKKIVDNVPQPVGDKLYFFDGSNLNHGLYVVKVTTNNVQHTKLIIKE